MRQAVTYLLVLFLLTPVSVRSATAATPAGLRIVGPAPANSPSPVVNEHGKMRLRVVDANGQSVAVAGWTTDSPSVAKMARGGTLKGKRYGFALITARTALGSVSAFVAVARVTPRRAAMVQGDAKSDAGGNVYLSSPSRHAIYKANAVSASILAGSPGHAGYADGAGQNARFDTPTGLAVDNRAAGGVYVADTLNDCIRKIDPRGRVTVALGTPRTPGMMAGDATSFDAAAMNGPMGVATVGENFYFTDTGNSAVYYADSQTRQVRLLCGEPGAEGLSDGTGREARFDHPSGLAVSTDGRLLVVADTGNNVIRLVEVERDEAGNLVGNVATLGVGSSARGVDIRKARVTDDPRDAIVFQNPSAVSIDATGNVYVVDDTGASVVTRPRGEALPRRVDLAQAGTLGMPVSVTLRGAQAFVLDGAARGDREAIKVAEVGPPRIDSVTPSTGPLEGGEEVVIEGANFSEEAKLTFGDAEPAEYTIESARRIRFRVPRLDAPGGRTVSVATRGGVAQAVFHVQAKRLSEIEAGQITTIAGGVPYVGDSGQAASAAVDFPIGVAIDGNGNLFLADSYHHRIRRVDATSGVVTTVVGTGDSGYNGDGIPATAARLNTPRGLAVDAAGNVFIADSDNQRVRRVDAATGLISTIAGTGQGGYSPDGTLATEAKLRRPSAVAVDAAGNVFVADRLNDLVRRIDAADGCLSTYAGTADEGSTDEGIPATSAELAEPYDLALDAGGNLFIAEVGYNRIRRVDASSRLIVTVAGAGEPGSDGDGGQAASAHLNAPRGVTVDSEGRLLVSDTLNHRIRRVALDGTISTIAGGDEGYGGDGGPATEARFNRPGGIAADAAGNIFVADFYNNRVRRIDAASGTIATVVGIGSGFSADGADARSAQLFYPGGMAFDGAGNLLVADTANHRIRRVDVGDGTIETIAGTGVAGADADGLPAAETRLDSPLGIAIDPAGNVVFTDRGGNRIRRIAANGRVETIAGTGEAGYDEDGVAARAARLNAPGGVAFDAAGNLYFSDTGNNLVRKIDPGGTITTIAGVPGQQGYNGNNIPAIAAWLDQPYGIAVDGDGNVVVVDVGNNLVRRITTSDGRITTIAGTRKTIYNGDSRPATTANLGFPANVLVTPAGDVLISDGNHRIRRVDRSNTITTIAGDGVRGYGGDEGAATGAHLNGPDGMLVDADGNLYVADSYNGAVRVVRAALPH